MDRRDERWEKLKAGLYDAIYGKGLAKPYLDATARLLDELKADYEALEQDKARLVKHARIIHDLLDLGDQRLLASDGPIHSSRRPELDGKEWRRVWAACAEICLLDAARETDDAT